MKTLKINVNSTEASLLRNLAFVSDNYIKYIMSGIAARYGELISPENIKATEYKDNSVYISY